MFRDMRRKKREITEAEARDVLQNGRRGVLAMNGDDGYPYCVPVNYFYEDGHIYIHSAKAGQKFDNLTCNDKVCFTVFDREQRNEGDWYWIVSSVVAYGRAKLEQDAAKTEAVMRKLGGKYFPSEDILEHEMESIDRVQLIDIEIEHLAGKRVKEK